MPAPLRFLLAALLVAAVAGCKPEEPIRSYSVPKEPTSKGPSPAAIEIPSDDKYRMLAAIIPAEPGYSWFVKFVGPSEVVSPLAADFTAFVMSVRTAPDKPTWEVPAGWVEAPPRPARLVTLKNGAAEMYLSGPFGGSLLDNVNRWRDEMGLRKVTEAELPGEVTEVKLDGVTAHTLDLRGQSWNGGAGMKPPFAGK